MSGNNISDEWNRKRSLGIPTNTDYEKKSRPADSNAVDIRIYLENNLIELNQLSRKKLEEITIQTLCKLIDQHINIDELVHELNEMKQKLASLQNKYNDLESQIAQESRSENNVLRTLDTMENANTISHTVSEQVGHDGLAPVIFIDLTDEDESTSSNDATPLTAGSEQVSIPEDNHVAEEDTALDGETISKIEKEAAPAKELQKSVV
ncbi:hypothetical protein CBL_06956 [Carabus blaptoides fortunei]